MSWVDMANTGMNTPTDSPRTEDNQRRPHDRKPLTIHQPKPTYTKFLTLSNPSWTLRLSGCGRVDSFHHHRLAGSRLFQRITSCFAVADSFDQTRFEQRIQEIHGSLFGKSHCIP